ncbi:MAG: hypothetical protein GX256_06920 [Fretibacterium sp.]|nr:hypothetical protein [Fretibacterium sp.]
MRWIVLALSLGASITSIGHEIVALLLSFPKQGEGGVFVWLTGTGALPIYSAFLALIGGVMAFNRRRLGGVFLVLAASICFFAHPDVRIYGWVYLVGGAIAFLLRPDNRYYYDDDEYDDYDEEEEDGDYYDDEVFEERAPAFQMRPRRRESSVRIRRPNQSLQTSLETEEAMGHKIRVRKSKTCPTCGATAAIHHKFCPNCGAQLHVPPHVLESPEVEEAFKTSSAPESYAPDEERAARLTPSEPSFQPSLPEREEEDEEKEDVFAKSVLPDEEELLLAPDAGLSKTSGRRGKAKEDGYPARAPVEPTPAHKVFVSPLRDDEEDVPRRALDIGPDSSYAEFSRYSRRRKRRPRSLPSRLFGMAFLLAIVGGAAWFLLGLRKLPEKELPVPPPVVVEVPELPSKDLVAEPVGTPKPDLLSGLAQAGLPARGVVSGSNVNLREDHSTASRSLTRLNIGNAADIMDQWEGVSGNLSGVWYRIRTSTNKEGWIYGLYFIPLRNAPLPTGTTAALLEPFGMTKDEAIAKLGQPERSTASSLSWSGLSITLSSNQVVRVQFSNSRHSLPNSLTVGMTNKELYGIMGYPSAYSEGQLLYHEADSKNVTSVRLKGGKVQDISVSRPTA